jgi:hypothetical protein
LAKLKDLTVPLLDKLAGECNIKFESSYRKADKIAKIEASNIPESKIQSLIVKYMSLKKERKSSKMDIISELKGRIRLLEEQVKFLMSKISVTEVQISAEGNRDLIKITSDLSDIKKIIKSLINPGETITIEDLIELREIQKIPLITLKHAIYDLIDENFLETIEGKSKQRLFGKIGILKRI